MAVGSSKKSPNFLPKSNEDSGDRKSGDAGKTSLIDSGSDAFPPLSAA
jgi:hypothetical protein